MHFSNPKSPFHHYAGKNNRVRKLPNTEANKKLLGEFGNFSVTGSIRGMKKLYYGKDALLVRCGGYIYNVSHEPKIYEQAT